MSTDVKKIRERYNAAVLEQRTADAKLKELRDRIAAVMDIDDEKRINEENMVARIQAQMCEENNAKKTQSNHEYSKIALQQLIVNSWAKNTAPKITNQT